MAQITVGIPVYNAMPYLPECMESILRQSYADFEILIINDGSTDGSLEYINSVCDPRVRVVSQSNQGLTATLNRMLAEANTPWLARQDADDVSYPRRLALIAEHIEKYPEAGMFYSLADYYPDGSLGQFRSARGTPEELREIVRSGYLLSLCHPSVTLSVEKTMALGGYRFDLYCEDIDLWWRMVLANDIRCIPEVTVGVRQNLQSTSSMNLSEQMLNGFYVQYLLLSHLWKRKPLPLESIRVPLESLIDRRKISSKQHLRSFNMQWGYGNKGKAMLEAAFAFALSPSNLMQRVTDHLVANRKIMVGESPQRFANLSSSLWPGNDKSAGTFFSSPDSILQ